MVVSLVPPLAHGGEQGVDPDGGEGGVVVGHAVGQEQGAVEELAQQLQETVARILDNTGKVLHLIGKDDSLIAVQNRWRANTNTGPVNNIELQPLGLVDDNLNLHPGFDDNPGENSENLKEEAHECKGMRDKPLLEHQTMLLLIGGAVFAAVISFLIGKA